MKKGILLSVLLCSILGFSYAQTSVEFIPMGGYTFSDKLGFPNTFGRIDAGFNYGGSFQFNMNRHLGIELMYNRLSVPAGLYTYGSYIGTAPIYQTQAGFNYIMAGPVSSFPIAGSSVTPFIGGLLGAAIFTPEPYDYSSNVRFAWGLQVGADVHMDPRFGLRFSGRLLGVAPSSTYYFGQWGDTGGGYYYYAPSVVQFAFNIGLIIGLGKVLPEYHKPARTYQHAPPPHPRRYYYY